MGVSTRTVHWLRDQGYDAAHLLDEGLHRLSEHEVLLKARREQRVVLTMDLDFGYLLAVSRARLPSVVIFRVTDERSEFLNGRLAEILGSCQEALRSGAVLSVGDESIRIRRLPI